MFAPTSRLHLCLGMSNVDQPPFFFLFFALDHVLFFRFKRPLARGSTGLAVKATAKTGGAKVPLSACASNGDVVQLAGTLYAVIKAKHDVDSNLESATVNVNFTVTSAAIMISADDEDAFLTPFDGGSPQAATTSYSSAKTLVEDENLRMTPDSGSDDHDTTEEVMSAALASSSVGSPKKKRKTKSSKKNKNK